MAMNVLKSECKVAIEWFTSNLCKPTQTNYKSYSSNHKQFLILFHNYMDISICTEVKLLGVYIDDGLTFDNHIKTICMNASRQLNVLIRIRQNLGYSQSKQV